MVEVNRIRRDANGRARAAEVKASNWTALLVAVWRRLCLRGIAKMVTHIPHFGFTQHGGADRRAFKHLKPKEKQKQAYNMQV
jgi:hypothetical protein